MRVESIVTSRELIIVFLTIKN